jgi:hypothetical protein
MIRLNMHWDLVQRADGRKFLNMHWQPTLACTVPQRCSVSNDKNKTRCK